MQIMQLQDITYYMLIFIQLLYKEIIIMFTVVSTF
jgi:hypothetical protein